MYHEARKSAAFEGGCSALHSLWEGTAKVLQNSVLLFFETAANFYFIFFPQLFITVLSSLGDLVTAVIQGSFSLEAMSSQLITVGAVLLITAVWGRFFCGFLCSFGTLQELLFFAAKKIFPRKLSVSPRTDCVLKYLKYVVFAGIAAISDGTYQGEGTGFRGTTSVSVTVENGAIVDITVESYEDDQEFFVRAESSVISEILSAQSLDVQTVSGATFSSNGIIEAVANALNVTFENPNGDAPAHGGHGGNRMGEDGAFAEREQFGKRRH